MDTELRALTILQPWAALIAHRYKQYETRSWSTKYRGKVVIHAGKNAEYADLIGTNGMLDAHFQKDTVRHMRAEMTFGTAICVAQLVDCVQMTERWIAEQTPRERLVGMWEPGRWAWKLDVLYLVEPIAVKGRQGLWHWPQDLKLSLRFALLGK